MLRSPEYDSIIFGAELIAFNDYDYVSVSLTHKRTHQMRYGMVEQFTRMEFCVPESRTTKFQRYDRIYRRQSSRFSVSSNYWIYVTNLGGPYSHIHRFHPRRSWSFTKMSSFDRYHLSMGYTSIMMMHQTKMIGCDVKRCRENVINLQENNAHGWNSAETFQNMVMR